MDLKICPQCGGCFHSQQWSGWKPHCRLYCAICNKFWPEDDVSITEPELDAWTDDLVIV